MTIPYEKISHDGTEFRIVEFAKRKEGDTGPLQVYLKKAALDPIPDYHCLSYVWGEKDFDFPIIVNGILTQVTQSLGLALQRLHLEPTIKALWADGLCINQNNAAEKNSQVRLMETIYRNAQGVYAWLGPADEEADEIMDIINDAGSTMLYHAMLWTFDRDYQTSLDARDVDGVSFAKALTLMAQKTTNFDNFADELLGISVPIYRACMVGSLSRMRERLERDKERTLLDVYLGMMRWITHPMVEKTMRCWNSFLNRDFWKRIWIVQELLLAKSVVLLCGQKKARIDSMLACIQFIQVVSQYTFGDTPRDKIILTELGEVMVKIMRSSIRTIWLHRARGEQSDSVYYLVDQLASLEATELVDKVYAILGIASNSEELLKTIDYKRSPIDLGIEVMRLGLIEHGITYLNLTDHFHSQRKAIWPSWISIDHCLDKDNSNMLRQTVSRFVDLQEYGFSASGDVTYNITEANFEGRTFRMSTYMAGTIYAVKTFTEEDWYWDTKRLGLKLLSDDIMGILKARIQDMRDFYAPLGLDDEKEPSFWWLTCFQRNPLKLNLSEDELLKVLLLMQAYYNAYQAISTGQEVDSNQTRRAQDWMSQMLFSVKPRHLFMTETGLPGVGPPCMEEGDELVVFKGSKVPHVIRPVESGNYIVLGQAYVLGIMHGEILEIDAPEKDIVLE